MAVGRKLQECLSAPRVDVVDETGAGDTFAGALAVALLRGQDSCGAARLAAAAASLAGTHYGSQAFYLTGAEIERLLAAEDSGR